jgi:hypothetical protein
VRNAAGELKEIVGIGNREIGGRIFMNVFYKKTRSADLRHGLNDLVLSSFYFFYLLISSSRTSS